MGTDNEETQYIHKPDTIPLDGLVCFLDCRRPCDATCAAYTTANMAGDELSEQQGHCSLLVSLNRMGKHAVIIASMMQSRMLQERKEREDKVRSLQNIPNHPAVPRGR